MWRDCGAIAADIFLISTLYGVIPRVILQLRHGKGVMIMARFVPKDKLSKKAQKELNRQRRVTWDFSPVTKTVDSKKLYNRKRNARDRYDDYGASVFHFYQISTEPVSSPLIHQSLF